MTDDERAAIREVLADRDYPLLYPVDPFLSRGIRRDGHILRLLAIAARYWRWRMGQESRR